MSKPARPFKAWNFDRSLKKSVTASSLEELLEKGCSKLGLGRSSQLKLVLEEDGTQVDEEEYFNLLPGNQTFLFLLDSEEWKPAGRPEPAGLDQTDNAGDFGNTVDDVHLIAHSLKEDISNIITLSSEQLQLLVDCDASTLAQAMGQTERYSRAVQTACQRHLDEHAQTREAIDLLKLYHQACTADGEQTKKRRKVDKNL